MKVSALQYDICWEDPAANLKMIEGLVEDSLALTDLLLLPEMFTTGFTMRPEKLAEGMDGAGMEWMKKKAGEWDVVIGGSLIIREGDSYYNRFMWVNPGGDIEFYDKRHLFRMGEEDKHYSMGKKKLITKLGDIRIRPLICYDLRFPVWSRNRNDYDVLIYVANWPASRRKVWTSLLMARALENQSYVIGVNRTGRDGMGTDYSGDSMVIDPRGNIISNAGNKESFLISAEIDIAKLKEFRNKFPAWQDADDFDIRF